MATRISFTNKTQMTTVVGSFANKPKMTPSSSLFHPFIKWRIIQAVRVNASRLTETQVARIKWFSRKIFSHHVIVILLIVLGEITCKQKQ